MLTKRHLLPILLTLSLCIFPPIASTCPYISGLVDYNCDEEFRVVFAGDSVVRGIGDTINNQNGGYPIRIKEALPGIVVTNLGVPGTTTGNLILSLTRKLDPSRNTKAKRALQKADLVILDIGRNDYWADRIPASTVRNIKRLVQIIKGAEVDNDPPVIAVTTLTPTTRDFQRTFIAEVTNRLLAARSRGLPVSIRFDLLPEEIISVDGIHPSSEGYDSIAQVVLEYISSRYQTIAENQRPDLDEDGVYDRYEVLQFGTDPTDPDSDDDGILDGEEIFGSSAFRR